VQKVVRPSPDRRKVLTKGVRRVRHEIEPDQCGDGPRGSLNPPKSPDFARWRSQIKGVARACEPQRGASNLW
jgi:hypothetical protein